MITVISHRGLPTINDDNKYDVVQHPLGWGRVGDEYNKHNNIVRQSY